ncbi:helix-turn-helix domain-containing protein [[Clostridium] leptum]|uniref:HTH cro/C1-type domain-containing protein n=1 Tax=Solibaculum mannosilyticum TaxID=2780922 RepID=A0A7I8D3V9_9FIRM|nr:helix-turn-helix transcriptional regulator [Solibaculum mannosilyticum]MCO7138165.1 helix-turn-helix domain-containing protein [[Clostridium] leptum]BCI59923.1 hypothetical protein C12CBH8_05620 [Solibaculum mannosilyticum]
MNKFIQDISIGENLLRLRKAYGLSQADLVSELQLRGSTMSRNTYSKIENGVRNIKISDLILLKVIYDVDFSELFDGLIPSDIPKLGQL